MADDQADAPGAPQTDDDNGHDLRVALRHNLPLGLYIQTPPLSASYFQKAGSELFDQVRLSNIDSAILDVIEPVIDIVVVYVDKEPIKTDHPIGCDDYDIALGGRKPKDKWPLDTDTKQKRALSAAPIAALTADDIEAVLQTLANAATVKR